GIIMSYDHSDSEEDCSIILPSQMARGYRDDPIRNLMIEILRDAIRCHQDKPKPVTKHHTKQYGDPLATEWLFDNESDGVFSVKTICQTLNVDLGALQARLRAGKMVNTSSLRYVGPTG
ncbi:MAG: hypothetical protein KGI06_06220, partial [Candidatus Micrarchaeota archaeon]|nr:hypothetical protein [Candidatus Micrarchaeota archaeon]